jgi:hypothetical protein
MSQLLEEDQGSLKNNQYPFCWEQYYRFAYISVKNRWFMQSYLTTGNL